MNKCDTTEELRRISLDLIADIFSKLIELETMVRMERYRWPGPINTSEPLRPDSRRGTSA